MEQEQEQPEVLLVKELAQVRVQELDLVAVVVQVLALVLVTALAAVQGQALGQALVCLEVQEEEQQDSHQ